MRLGIIGLPGSGKATVFQALTGSKPEEWGKKASIIGTVLVPDERVEALTKLFEPKKTVYAHLEYILPWGATTQTHDRKGDEGLWSEVRPCDALVHVVRNFRLPEVDALNPKEDLLRLESEMVFADLMVVEKRIERMDLDRKRGKEMNDEERGLLEACRKVLEDERPLRDDPELAVAPLLRGYTFLSAKPVLIVYNNEDEDEAYPPGYDSLILADALVVRGKIETELAELSPEEAAEFLEAYHIKRSATERVVRYSCDLLGLISFFTVVRHEVRCWMIPKGTTALDGAGVIHSDMKKGFIRAEVLAFDDLITAGTYQEAKKEAKVHLEGKDYVVQDGDVIYFRFNV